MALPIETGPVGGHRLVVFIGRFQPFHLGHLRTLRLALSIGQHVLVVIGSAWHARTLRNSFMTSEVERMIRGSLNPEENARLSVRGVEDAYNDTAWIGAVHNAAASAAAAAGVDITDESRICLMGHRKDETSFYLDLFPRWSLKAAPAYEILNATDVRNLWMQDRHADFSAMVPPATAAVIRDVGASPAYEWLQGEKTVMQSRGDDKGRAPLIYTCDGVVIQSGYVMLVTRDKPPGKGLLSLPGGFLKKSETSRMTLVWNLVADHGLLASAGRTREEAARMVDGYVTSSELFDHPWRSERGRAISSTYLVEIPPGASGLSSLRRGPLGTAGWYALSGLEALRESFYEDHGYIIKRLASRSRWSV